MNARFSDNDPDRYRQKYRQLRPRGSNATALPDRKLVHTGWLSGSDIETLPLCDARRLSQVRRALASVADRLSEIEMAQDETPPWKKTAAQTMAEALAKEAEAMKAARIPDGIQHLPDSPIERVRQQILNTPSIIDSAAKAVAEAESDQMAKALAAAKRITERPSSIYAFLDEHDRQKMLGSMAKLKDIAASLKASAPPVDRSEQPPHSLTDIDLASTTMPFPEQTPIGRATLDSAAHTKRMSEGVAELATIMAEIHDMLVKKVFPAWFAQVTAAEDKAQQSYSQAADSIRLAKWAIWISAGVAVVVTIAATWWQTSISRDMDAENGKQQARIEAIMSELLAAQRLQADQQAADSTALRELLERQQAGKALKPAK